MESRVSNLFLKPLFILFIFLGLLHCLTPVLYSQEGGSARIYHMSGMDFALSLNGERSFVPVDVVNTRGMPLERSGIVHTGPETFLEIQLLPSGTVIKVSENTSLIYNGLDETGKFQDIGLLYGRIRLVTGNEADSIVIRGGGVSAKIIKGDFGADYLLVQGEPNSAPRPFFNISALRGSAEVFPYGLGASSPYFGGVNILTVDERECLSLDISSFHTLAEKKPLDSEILMYWRLHGFNGSPPMPMPNTRIALVEPTPTPIPPPPATQIRLLRAPQGNQQNRNLILGLGLGLTVSAVAIQAITHPQSKIVSDADLSQRIFNFAYFPMGLGLVTLLGGILYNPDR